MFLDELAREVFSLLCHQDPARSFQPGGVALAMCARCVGVYAGFVLALPMLAIVGRLPRKLAGVLHGVLVLQVIPFGFHLIRHGPTLRTISGQLFAVGVMYFLIGAVRGGESGAGNPTGPRRHTGRWLACYLLTIIQSVVLLQLLLRLPWSLVAAVVNGLALAGLGVFVGHASAFALALIEKYIFGRCRDKSFARKVL